jgi:hypothetical protein
VATFNLVESRLRSWDTRYQIHRSRIADYFVPYGPSLTRIGTASSTETDVSTNVLNLVEVGATRRCGTTVLLAS